MFARVFALLPFALLVVANQCNTSSPNCCNPAASGSAGSPAIKDSLTSAGLGGLIGSLLVSVDAVIFTDCTGVLGTGADCSQTPVCCENNLNGGLIGVNCSPIKVL